MIGGPFFDLPKCLEGIKTMSKPNPNYAPPTSAAEIETARKRRMGAISIMQKQLEMDEETLRDLMFTTVRLRSRRQMSLHQLTMVRDALVAKGGKLTAPGGGRKLAVESQAGKLRALWLRGHALGIVRDPSEQAMCSWASNSRSPNVTALLQSFGIAEFDAVIERMKKWLEREIIQNGEFVCPEHGAYVVPKESHVAYAKAVIFDMSIHCQFCNHDLEWRPKTP